MVNYRHCVSQQVFRTYSICFMEDLYLLNNSIPEPLNPLFSSLILLWCWKCILVFTYTEDTKGWKIHCPFLASTTNWDLPLAPDTYLYRSEVTCCCSHWLSTHPGRSSGWRAETRHSELWEKPCRTGLFRELNIFRCQFYEPSFYIFFFFFRKALKSFMVTAASHD